MGSFCIFYSENVETAQAHACTAKHTRLSNYQRISRSNGLRCCSVPIPFHARSGYPYTAAKYSCKNTITGQVQSPLFAKGGLGFSGVYSYFLATITIGTNRPPKTRISMIYTAAVSHTVVRNLSRTKNMAGEITSPIIAQSCPARTMCGQFRLLKQTPGIFILRIPSEKEEILFSSKY